jgi:hypothetical protein
MEAAAVPELARNGGAVILHALDLWRVRLVVRTQPSQGWCTGSTPVRAANSKLGRPLPAAIVTDEEPTR